MSQNTKLSPAEQEAKLKKMRNEKKQVELREQDPLNYLDPKILSGDIPAIKKIVKDNEEHLVETNKRYLNHLDFNACYNAGNAWLNWQRNTLGSPIQVQEEAIRELENRIKASVTIYKGAKVGSVPKGDPLWDDLKRQKDVLNLMITAGLDYIAKNTFGYKSWEESKALYDAEQELWKSWHAEEEK